ncbi:hypothetical protein BC830DRAFT_1159592, partial [Chytriomyces sp. MP71]
EILGILSLVLPSAAFSRDPFFTQTPELDDAELNTLNLGVSAELFITSVCLNTLITIVTFFRYRSSMFPSKLTLQQSENAAGDTTDIEMDRRNSTNSFASAFSNPLPAAATERFEAWTRSVSQSHLPTTRTPTHAPLESMQPAIIHDTKSNHSGGSLHHYPTAAPSAGNPFSSPVSSAPPNSIPSMVHETRSNYSGTSLYHTTPPPPPPSLRLSQPDDPPQLTKRINAGKRRGSFTASVPLPLSVVAVVPPPRAELDEIDLQLWGGGVDARAGIGVEYIEMRPARGEASLRSGATVMGTVVFDD